MNGLRGVSHRDSRNSGCPEALATVLWPLDDSDMLS
jgi:hypothetical protein